MSSPAAGGPDAVPQLLWRPQQWVSLAGDAGFEAQQLTQWSLFGQGPGGLPPHPLELASGHFDEPVGTRPPPSRQAVHTLLPDGTLRSFVPESDLADAAEDTPCMVPGRCHDGGTPDSQALRREWNSREPGGSVCRLTGYNN